MADYAYGPMDVNPNSGRITYSYDSMMGKVQPAHLGSQSNAPGKEEEGHLSWENVDMDKNAMKSFGMNK